uniref:Cytochrome P450 15 n=1 Tax=Streltzoviella insularis TaxID=1206366 RepID=A0A7D5YU20_9NEOP|nr:cytochrome P450 15 [Streltzoviella insularis]
MAARTDGAAANCSAVRSPHDGSSALMRRCQSALLLSMYNKNTRLFASVSIPAVIKSIIAAFLSRMSSAGFASILRKISCMPSSWAEPCVRVFASSIISDSVYSIFAVNKCSVKPCGCKFPQWSAIVGVALCPKVRLHRVG